MSRRHLEGLVRSIAAAIALPLVAGLCACRDDRKPEPESAPAPPAGTASPGLGTPRAPAVGSAAKGGVMLKVGEVAPEFKAKDHTGKDRTLAEFRGKRVVLWFYPKAATGG